MTIEKLDASTPDLTRQNIERLLELFPECRTEGSRDEAPMVDFDLLRQSLSDYLVEGPAERYRLDWPGKRQALLTANTPIDKTLRPMREESVDFDTTRNLFIEGDNLDALKLLQETYLGKVKMIYIDPPYNTGSDLIYDDDYSSDREEYELESEQRDELGGRLVANPESNGRFHSDWLSMILPRLKLAKNLLADDGVIFVSIGDDEVKALAQVLDEVFGAANQVSQVPRVAKRTSDKGTHFRPTKDYVLVYAKNIEMLPEFGVPKERDEKDYKFTETDGRKYKKSGASLYQPSLDPRPNQRYFIEAPDGSLIIPPGNVFPTEKKDGAKIKPQSKSDKVWRWSVDTYLKQKNLLIFTEASAKNPLVDENGNQSKWNIYPKVYYDEDLEATLHPEDVIYDYPNSQGTKELKSLGLPFSFAKPTGLISYLARLLQSKEAIVVDFFAGSGTTAHAVMRLNAEDQGSRKFIMVQLDEPCEEESEEYAAGFRTIAALAKERIRRAGKKIAEDHPGLLGRIDTGFRAFRIESSNFLDTRVKPREASQESLAGMVSHIKDDRSEEDLLFGALLRWGVDITLPIEQRELAGRKVWLVDAPEDGSGPNSGRGAALIACFAKPGSTGKGGIDTELADAMAALAPLRVLFRDDGFADDATKENVHSRFKQLAPDTQVRVL
ncbi:site-specific DNA-methyltransferase [Citromicrobium bathyomarinum]|uniref:site-specific DNA-methyltransferase n=1 Tax=Citromicrobium bathyomarinum TaxID=72174 RepID=UPI00315A6885